MKDAMETAHEITKLIKYSPRREGIFHTQRDSDGDPHGSGLCVLCPTRWTVQADSLASIMSHYAVLQETWVEAMTNHELDFCCDFYKDAERTCLQSQLLTFWVDFVQYSKQKFVR